MTHPFLKNAPMQLFIDGGWRPAISGETFDCINSSTGQVLLRVARGGAADIDVAVAAARRAFTGEWADWKPFDRQSLILRVVDAIEQRFDELAHLESLDMGAPIARTSQFRRWIRQTFQYCAAAAMGLRGDVFSNSVPGDFLSYSSKLPLGVVGAIIPWNGALITQLGSICSTLASGCTIAWNGKKP